jgi:hypothetical protein
VKNLVNELQVVCVECGIYSLQVFGSLILAICIQECSVTVPRPGH